jgi:hypothetical protein
MSLENPQENLENEAETDEEAESSNPAKEYRDNLASKLKGIEDREQKKEVLEREKGDLPYKFAEGIHRKGLEISDVSKEISDYEAKINGKVVKFSIGPNDSIVDAYYGGSELNRENASKIAQVVQEAYVLSKNKDKNFEKLDEKIANAEVAGLFKQ